MQLNEYSEIKQLLQDIKEIQLSKDNQIIDLLTNIDSALEKLTKNK